MKTTTRLKLAIAGLLLLGGCAPGPHVRVLTNIYNLGGELPANMVKVNLIAMVGLDEVHASKLSRASLAILYMAGASADTPEVQYRVVRITLRHLTGFLHIKDGAASYGTAAMAPDGMPELKAFDIVEVRQTGTYDTLKDFSKTKEGNAVLRILCRKSSPDYEACAEALPRIGEFRAWGYTGTPYLPTLAEYGLKFSVAYTEDGKLIRPLPK